MGLSLGMKIDEHGNAVPGSGSVTQTSAVPSAMNFGGNTEPNF
jgi:hypothetical protein